jgi:hypothetical protein
LKICYHNILASFLEHNFDLRKLKLSWNNLNDDDIVEILCKLIESERKLTSLDLSWGGLRPKLMLMISMSLNE